MVENQLSPRATTLISPHHSLGYEGWFPNSYLHPTLVTKE